MIKLGYRRWSDSLTLPEHSKWGPLLWFNGVPAHNKAGKLDVYNLNSGGTFLDKCMQR